MPRRAARGVSWPARCGTGRSAGVRRPGSARPRGFAGRPSAGQCSAAASSASCTASSAASKSPNRRMTVPRTCGASSRSRSSIAVPGFRPPFLVQPPFLSSRLGAGRAHHLPYLDLLPDRRTAGTWRGRGLRGDLDRPRLRLDVHHPVPGQQFLGLRERAVGHDRAPGPSKVTNLASRDPRAPGRR